MELFLVNRLQHGLPNEINKNDRSQKTNTNWAKAMLSIFEKREKYSLPFFFYIYFMSLLPASYRKND